MFYIKAEILIHTHGLFEIPTTAKKFVKVRENKQKYMEIWKTICELIFSPMGPPLPCEIHNPSL